MSYISFLNNSDFLLLAFIASIFLATWIKEKKTLSIRKFKPLNSNFFFYRDPQKNIHFISKSLKHLFNVRSKSMDTDALISYFENSDQSKLKELCYHSVYDSNTYSNSIAKLKVKEEISKKQLYLACSKVLLSDKKGRPQKAFFLFFSDVTAQTLEDKHLKYENELFRKELLYKNNILNTIPMPIWARNGNLDIKYFNNAYSQIISDLGCDVNNSVPEISKKQKAIAQKARRLNVTQFEEKHLVCDGKRLLYEIQEIPVQGTDAVLGLGYDITSKEVIQSELKMNISAQSDLLESTASANAIFDSKMRLKFFNQAFIKLWDLEEKWLVSNPTYGEILEKLREKRQLPEQIDFQKFKIEHMNLFTDLTSTHNDFFYLPDGRYLRVIVIPHALGGLLFSYEDITDKLTLEREYKTLSAVQKETIDHLNEGITVFSENGKLQISNERFAQIWGLDKTYLKSKPHIMDIIKKIQTNLSEGSNAQIDNIFLNNINSRKTKNLRLQTSSHSTIDLLFVPLPDGATLISYHNITDSILVEKTLIEKNNALEAADRLKTEFLANVSYELRSPLTSIIGFSQALDKQYFGKLNELQSEYISGINDSSQYLLTLINDILDLASIDAGQMHLYLKKFDIYDNIISLVDLIRERVKEKKLKFTFLCSDDIGYMIGDSKRIKQVLFKLISNAIGNSNPGQEIKLSIQKGSADTVEFKVEDNSTTISTEEQKYIFDIFHKVNSNKIKSKSAALGLVLVKSFVELHGGTIKFKRKKTKGIIFQCTLPTEPPKEVYSINTEDEHSQIKHQSL